MSSQLPPKVPPQNWPPPFPPHQKMPPLTTNITKPPPSTPTSWVDEFLDFTSVRRGTHRRSMSDSIAFLETPLRNNGGGFDRLDDEQLMSMFSDEQASNNEDNNPRSTDNNDNDNGQSLQETCFPKSEPAEIESDSQNVDADNNNAVFAALSENNAATINHSDDVDPFNFDPKRIKRVLANRQSAQRSRVRKLQYISELERSVTSLQTEVSVLSPRVAYLDHQRLILNVDNSAIKQRIAALAQDKIFMDAHQEALKKEIERLRQIYQHQQQQNMKKMGGSANCGNNATTTATVHPPTSDHNMGCTEKEQLMT